MEQARSWGEQSKAANAKVVAKISAKGRFINNYYTINTYATVFTTALCSGAVRLVCEFMQDSESVQKQEEVES